MTEKNFSIGQVIHLRDNMKGNDAGKSFYFGGNIELHSTLVRTGIKLGYEINESTIISAPAKVKKYLSYNSEKKCHEIEVEWLNPFVSGDKAIQHDCYTMLESEFYEYVLGLNDSPKQNEFVAGDWVYYMGGMDTSFWKPGLVGQISQVTSDAYRFENYKGDMTQECGNYKKHFRRATIDEINRASREEFFTDSHGYVYSKKGEVISRPNEMLGNPCAEIKLDLPTAHTMAVFVSAGEPSKPLIKNDETKVSFQSTKLVANKINNSKDIENLLILD